MNGMDCIHWAALKCKLRIFSLLHEYVLGKSDTMAHWTWRLGSPEGITFNDLETLATASDACGQLQVMRGFEHGRYSSRFPLNPISKRILPPGRLYEAMTDEALGGVLITTSGPSRPTAVPVLRVPTYLYVQGVRNDGDLSPKNIEAVE